MRRISRLAVVLAAATIAIAPCAEAAWLSVVPAVSVATGWTRIAGHYGSVTGEPGFRAVVHCGGGSNPRVLQPVVHLAPSSGALWLDLPGTPDQLVAAESSCQMSDVSIEMLADATVVASATVPREEVTARGPSVVVAPPRPSSPSRFSLKSQKYGEPLGRRTEAGVSWALDSRISLQLNYERTAQAPMMPVDHDDGILTRVQVGF